MALKAMKILGMEIENGALVMVADITADDIRFKSEFTFKIMGDEPLMKVLDQLGRLLEERVKNNLGPVQPPLILVKQ